MLSSFFFVAKYSASFDIVGVCCGIRSLTSRCKLPSKGIANLKKPQRPFHSAQREVVYYELPVGIPRSVGFEPLDMRVSDVIHRLVKIREYP